jgi:cardiolipin synthase A/B
MARGKRAGAKRARGAWAAVVVTVLVTTFAVVLVLNLSLADKTVDQDVPALYSVEDAQFTRIMNVMLGPPIVEGNRVTTLVNGDRIFPAMLDALRGAKKTITFEMYIYWSGRIGKEFADVLAERARAGVKVHVLLDGVGAGKIDDAFIEQMERAGVEVKRYNPPRPWTIGRFNNRTHRKIVVVDGRVAFTGGVGIADQWLGDGQDPEHWRDTHFRVEGPVVAQLQAAFMDNWTEITGSVLHGEDYFPRLESQGPQRAQMFMSSPGGSSESMQLMYLLSIAAAQKTIDIAAAYFVPDNVDVSTLVGALKRGVRVRIVLPGRHIDAGVVRRASRARWGELLEAGAEIHEYQPTMYHCKVMVVDGLWTSVGSTNFDNRSFSVNDEANLNVQDREFAREQTRIFEEDLKRARRITLEEWRDRPWTEKLWENAASIFRSQL